MIQNFAITWLKRLRPRRAVFREASAKARGEMAGSPTRQPRWGARGAPPPVKKRLRPHRAADMEIRGEVSAKARAGGGAPAPVRKSWRGTDRRESRSACGHASGRKREARRAREASASGGGAPRESKECSNTRALTYASKA